MSRLIAALLMLSGWLSSSHFSPWVSWHSEVPFFVLVLGVALLHAWRMNSADVIQWPAAALLPVVFGCVLLAQTLAGMVTWVGQAVVVAFYLGLMWISIVWGWNEGQENRLKPAPDTASPGEWLAWTLVVGSVLSFVIALAQIFEQAHGLSFITPMTGSRRPGANLAQPNHLASLLVMGMAAVCYLQIQRRLTALFAAVLILLGIVGVAITESRGGLISLVALIAFWSVMRPLSSGAASRKWGGVAALTAMASFLAWPRLHSIMKSADDENYVAIGRIAESGTDPRITLWQQLFEASLLKPWFGWGIRDTSEAHNSVLFDAPASLVVTYSHNVILDLAIWIGWPLAALLLLVSGIWIWRRVKYAKNKPLVWFGIALIIPMAVHSLLEFPFAYAYFLFPTFMAVGYIEAAARAPALRPGLSKFVALPLMGVTCLVGAWSVHDYLRMEEEFRMARHRLLRIGVASAVPPTQVHLLNHLNDLINSTWLTLDPGMSDGDLMLLRRVALHFPSSASQYRYSMALALNDNREEAIRQLYIVRAQYGHQAKAQFLEQINLRLTQSNMPRLVETN